MSVHFLNDAAARYDGVDLAAPALGLTTRAFNLLRRGGFRTVADVEAVTDDDLRAIRNMRESDLALIRTAIGEYRSMQDAVEPHPAFAHRATREW